MLISKKCDFYRYAESLAVGTGLGHCDLFGQAICDGEIQFCQNSEGLRKELLKKKEKEVGKNREEGQKENPFSYKVLVVEDEEPLRNIVVAFLSKQGHQCITASNGIDALSEVYHSKFDAVITDIVMPKMDGIALTKELLSMYPRLPIMVMTGFSEEYSAESAIKAGARDFIGKPFGYEEFSVRFNKIMTDHNGEEGLITFLLKDELTNLSDRRRFFVLAEQYLKVAIHAKKGSLLFYIDMDRLKWINDHCGHKEGDKALIALANILKKTFRESDIIARIGGDEFAVLLEPAVESNEKLITQLYENIRDYNANVTQDYKLSVSVGTVYFDPDHPISITQLLSKADTLMYSQKRNKKEKESWLGVRNGQEDFFNLRNRGTVICPQCNG